MNTLIDIALTSSHKASHLLVIVYVALSGHSDTHAYVQTHILVVVSPSIWCLNLRKLCKFSIFFTVKSICRPVDVRFAQGKHLAVVTAAAKRHRSYMCQSVCVEKDKNA